ncbi:hypothetical protein OROMI_025842 [Orobanche minor]
MRKIRLQPDLRLAGFTEFGYVCGFLIWFGFGPRFRTGDGGKVVAVGISGTRWQWLEISGFDRNQQRVAVHTQSQRTAVQRRNGDCRGGRLKVQPWCLCFANKRNVILFSVSADWNL